jgi:hypothetical protein
MAINDSTAGEGSGAAAPAGQGTQPVQPTISAASTDYAAYYANLKPENAEILKAKGWDKNGQSGGYADVNTLLDSLRSAEALIGKNNLPQPDPLSPDFDNWPGFKALGVPDKPDGYEFKRPDMPLGADGKEIPYDDEAEKVLRQALFDGKVPAGKAQKAYDQLVSLQVARAQAIAQEIQRDRADTDANLTREWGAKKGEMTAKAQNALRQVAQKIGVDPNTLAMDGNAVLGSTGVTKLFAFLHDELGEDKIVPADGRAGDLSTPAGRKATLQSREANPDWMKALNDKNHPRHQDVVNERRILLGLQ